MFTEEEQVNERVTKAAKSMCLAAFFCLYGRGLCDTVSQSKNPSWKEGLCWGTVRDRRG